MERITTLKNCTLLNYYRINKKARLKHINLSTFIYFIEVCKLIDKAGKIHITELETMITKTRSGFYKLLAAIVKKDFLIKNGGRGYYCIGETGQQIINDLLKFK